MLLAYSSNCFVREYRRHNVVWCHRTKSLFHHCLSKTTLNTQKSVLGILWSESLYRHAGLFALPIQQPCCIYTVIGLILSSFYIKFRQVMWFHCLFAILVKTLETWKIRVVVYHAKLAIQRYSQSVWWSTYLKHRWSSGSANGLLGYDSCRFSHYFCL